MTKICTTIEQSKKLIELGIDVNTADMWYLPIKDSHKLVTTPSLTRGIIPAWSLSALLELIPNYVINKSDGKINLYYGLKVSHDNLVDAAFVMICCLKENRKI